MKQSIMGLVRHIVVGLKKKKKKKKKDPTKMYNQSKISCDVPWCKNCVLNHSKAVKLYTFPSDPQLRNLWLKMIGRPNMRVMSHSAVCSIHFKDGQRNALNPVPTIFWDQSGNEIIKDPELETVEEIEEIWPEYPNLNLDQNHANTLWTGVLELCKENKLLDVLIIAREEYIPSQKIVLVTMSPYFCFLLNNTPSISCIILDLPASIIKALLRFFYTGELEFAITQENVNDVKEAATLLCIEGVLWKCNELLRIMKMTKDETKEVPQSISVNKKDHGKMALRLATGAYQLLVSKKLCDLILLVGHKTFHVHKLILASLSPYFRSILTDKLPVTSVCINLSAGIFESILRFLYTGHNDIQINKLNIFEVKKVADFLIIPSLQNKCLEYLFAMTNGIDKLDLGFFNSLMSQETVQAIIEVFPVSENDFGFVDNCKNMLEKALAMDTFIYVCSRCGVENENCKFVEEHIKCMHKFGTVIKIINSKNTENGTKTFKDIVNELHNNDVRTKSMETSPGYCIDVFICVECGFTGKDMSILRVHLNAIHSDVLKKEGHYNEAIENIFNQKVCKLLWKSDGSYICGNCELVLKTSNIIFSHIKYCSASRIQCYLCEFSTDKKPPLLVHLFIKHNISVDGHKLEIFRCQYCEFVTWDGSFLNDHLETHIEQRLILCHICGQGFTNKANMIEHIHFHNVDKRFECKECSYKCRTKHLLNQHIKCKHSNVRYLCPWCSYRSGLKGNIKIHVQRRHPFQLGSYTPSSLQIVGNDNIDEDDEEEDDYERNESLSVQNHYNNGINPEPVNMELGKELALPETMLECVLVDKE